MSEQKEHSVFQAISDPTRRKILKLLADKEMSIAEIADQFPISRTAVNKHLKLLSSARVVKSRKAGRESLYILEAKPLVEIKEWLTFFEHYWDDKLADLKTYVEQNLD